MILDACSATRPIRSLRSFSGMIPGEEPPYRPLLTEKIDIEQGVYRSEVN